MDSIEKQLGSSLYKREIITQNHNYIGITPDLALLKSELHITKSQLAKVKNLYAFISQVNQNIVRVKNEKTLFRNACRMAIEFGKFKMAWIGLFDIFRKKITLIEQSGVPDDDTIFFRSVSFKKNSPQQSVLKCGRHHVCNEFEKDIELSEWNQYIHHLGIQSCLVLPIKKDGKIIGTFNLYSIEQNFSGKEEIDLLVEVTDDISFALDRFEKAKIHQQTVAQLVRKEISFREMFESAAECLVVFDITTLAFVKWNENAVKLLKFTKAEFSKKGPLDISPVFQPDGNSSGEKVKCLIADILKGNKPVFEWMIADACGKEIICEFRLTPFSSENGYQILASFVEITEQKLMEEKLLKSENQIRNFAKHINKVLEDERAHLAREIHDELGQQLAGIKMGLSLLVKPREKNNEAVCKMMVIVDETIQSLRKIATELRPGILDTFGLIASIEWLASEFEKKTKIKCDVKLNVANQKFEKDISTCFFRICQESLNNISKHAEATRVTFEIHQDKNALQLKIIDNGKGIDNEKLMNPFSMGLLGMRERAFATKSELKISSKKEKGTTVFLKHNFVSSDEILK